MDRLMSLFYCSTIIINILSVFFVFAIMANLENFFVPSCTQQWLVESIMRFAQAEHKLQEFLPVSCYCMGRYCQRTSSVRPSVCPV